MAVPVAKNRLHASKVSRIALVDRPAVPDAEMVAYKRRDKVQENKNYEFDVEKMVGLIKDKKFDECSKEILNIDKGYFYADFNVAFIFKGIYAAVDALNNEVWDAIYSDTENKSETINKAISDFEELMLTVFIKLGKKNKAEKEEKIKVDEMKESVNRMFSLNAIAGTFENLSYMMTFIVLEQSEFEDAKGTITGVMEVLKEFINKNLEGVINKSFAEMKDEDFLFEKAGRVISAARLKKLKESAVLINEIISEAETENNDKTESEANKMSDITKEEFEVVTKSVEGIVEVLKTQGYLLNEEEQKEFDKKKQEIADKAKEDQDEVVRKAKDAQDIIDKEASDAQEVINKAKTDQEITDKAWKEDINKGMETLKEMATSLETLTTSLNKRLGISKIAEGEETVVAGETDVFAEGLQNKTPVNEEEKE